MFDDMELVDDRVRFGEVLQNSFAKAQRHVAGYDADVFCVASMRPEVFDKTPHRFMVFAFCHIQDIAPLKIHGNGDVVVSLAARFIHPDSIHCRKIRRDRAAST